MTPEVGVTEHIEQADCQLWPCVSRSYFTMENTMDGKHSFAGMIIFWGSFSFPLAVKELYGFPDDLGLCLKTLVLISDQLGQPAPEWQTPSSRKSQIQS